LIGSEETRGSKIEILILERKIIEVGRERQRDLEGESGDSLSQSQRKFIEKILEKS
jgi:hypothetical protein